MAITPGPSRYVPSAIGTAASRRGHASASSLPSSATGPRIAPLDRDVLELSGPDAQKFLKGLSCKDVESTGGGYSGFMNASGRVLHTTFIHPNGPQRYLISHQSSPDHPAPLPKLLAPFRLRSKVRIKDVTADWAAWSAWGEDVGEPSPRRTWKLGSGGAAESHWEWESLRPAGAGPEEVACWDLRAGFGARGMGRQMLVPRGKEPALLSTHDLATSGDYDLHRMRLGVPEGPAEIVPMSALPLESCMDIHGGVDFRKGCYLGQELTVRTYHTGMTRKRILPIRLIPLNAAETPLREFLIPSSSTPPVSLSKPEPVDL
ncbi:ccr4 associated factor [Saitozyma podzolica]|uniref:Ccr4 associated factor n=1 Tax=Saitozyma podzolica TaxID=1890683 RepID=A0A427YE96_9TREE|nr:ccr4 associated factor [Saitozyma podzolica]